MASESMMTIIKNNRKLLPQRDRFKTKLGGYNKTKKTEYNLPKATKKELNTIAKKIKTEQRIADIKVVALTIVGAIIVYTLLFLR